MDLPLISKKILDGIHMFQLAQVFLEIKRNIFSLPRVQQQVSFFLPNLHQGQSP